MLDVNLWFGWIWITVGFVSGAAVGVYFYDPHWLGGYSSWRRRMVRLAHISFLGTGLLNLAFVFTVATRKGDSPAEVTSWLFLAGAITMPLVCFLAAWKVGFRHLFFIPVGCLIAATTTLIVLGVL